MHITAWAGALRCNAERAPRNSLYWVGHGLTLRRPPPLPLAAASFFAAALQSFRHAVGPVPVLTKALYTNLGGLPELHPGSGWRDFKATVTLSEAAWAELEFWYQRLPLWNGRPVSPQRVTRVLYTDASGGGWGGILARVRGRGYGPEVLRMSSSWDNIDSVSTLPSVSGCGILSVPLLSA